MNELEYVVRSLRKSARFTIAAVATLALGISSTTAIFSVVHSVLLAPLPFPSANRLVVPVSTSTKTGGNWSVSYGDFMDWRDNHVFTKIAVFQPTSMDMAASGDPVRVQAAAVSPQFFEALAIGAARGSGKQTLASIRTMS
jgi:hypothetical protein